MPTPMLPVWPDEIRAEVRSPFSILAEVSDELSERTRGTLTGEVRRASDDKGRTVLVFDVVVPALDHFRLRVLRLAYDEHQVYPAIIDAEAVNPTPLDLIQQASDMSDLLNRRKVKPSNQADSDTELISLIRKVSNSLVATMQSLIARANDATKAKEREARLRQIDDQVTALGHRYDPLSGQIAAVGGSEGGTSLSQEPQEFLSRLSSVSLEEWRAYLKWKKELAEEESYQGKADRSREERETEGANEAQEG